MTSIKRELSTWSRLLVIVMLGILIGIIGGHLRG